MFRTETKVSAIPSDCCPDAILRAEGWDADATEVTLNRGAKSIALAIERIARAVLRNPPEAVVARKIRGDSDPRRAQQPYQIEPNLWAKVLRARALNAWKAQIS